MKTLCIVPCGRKKIWDKFPDTGPTKAEKVYIGPFASKCKDYAVKNYPDSWCILSAKYGLLFPDEIVPGPYDVSFNNKNTNPMTLDALYSQIKNKRFDRFNEIVVLGGKNYLAIIRELFPSKTIHAPLSNCKGIGYMMGKLTKSIKRGIAL